jgi:hypothetical protein
MRKSDPRLVPLVVDAQEILFPDGSAWEELRAEPTLDGFPIASPQILFSKLDLIAKYSELAFGLGQMGAGMMGEWRSYEFLKLGERLQRVHLEGRKCSTCGWTGLAATAAVGDIYMGSPEADQAFQIGDQLPTVPCPVCKTPFPRRKTVWTQPMPSS